ncbi:MAG: ParM/StbA family protein [Leptolyngbya sp. BL-A-14]
MNGRNRADSTYRAIACADLGNRYLKWIDANGTTRCIPSVIKELDDWEDATFSDRTLILEVDGRRYAIGELAKALGGFSVFSESKTDWAWLLGLVALEPNLGEVSVLIEKMRYAIPDARNRDDLLSIKRLEGTHDFKLNGRDRIATVRSVEPWDETRAAYRYAVAKGMFRYPGLTNGIITMGGGTTNASLFAPDGTQLRGEDVIAIGTFGLAEKIATALLPSLGHSLEPALIMDAIERGDYRYGHPSEGTYFEPQFQKATAAVIQELRQKLKTRWAAKLAANAIGEVLICGGSAPLLKPLEEQTKQRFRVPAVAGQPDLTQFMTLHGMAL